MFYFKFLLNILFIFLLTTSSYALEYINKDKVLFNNSSKVMGATVPTTFMLFSFNPDIIAGWNTPLYNHEKKYIPKKYHNLDVLGGWYGNGNQPNKETLLTKKIDAAFVIGARNLMTEKIADFMNTINIPFIAINGISINDDIEVYNKLGELFNNKKRSDEINKYIKKSIANTNNITKKVKTKKKVFLALGDNGLKTRCVDSVLIAGAEYVHKCNKIGEMVSFEQLLNYNPDVIIIGKKNAYKSIMSDKKWQNLKAVKNHNILFLPEEPFSWVEKKTIMEYFVIQYLAAKLYPEYANIDLESELIEHMNIFMHYNLTHKQADYLLNYELYNK